MPAVVGQRGEYLLPLDDGVEQDKDGEMIISDYITDETFGHLQKNKDLSSYISLLEYLNATGRPAPEKAFYLNYVGTSAFKPDEATVPELAEPKDIKSEITDKLVKSMYMHFNAWGNKCRRTLEEVLTAHNTGKRTFWEVYSGDALLAQVFAENGWKVNTFDIANGWDGHTPRISGTTRCRMS